MKGFLVIVLFFALPLLSKAQLEELYVERYYVADSTDAAFQSETPVIEGEVTYRIYLKLASGSKLKEIFGDGNHPFRIESSGRFFNHSNGVSFGYNANKSDYEDDTFPLDSYLTLGQLAKQGGRRYFGIPRDLDIDGSFVGGDNNSNGLLVNPSFSLDVTDGIDTLNLFIDDFTDFGVADFSTGNDSTIFGSLVTDSSYVSNSMKLQCSGVYGVVPDSNYVLIAQLTTLGELSLSINAVVADSAGVEHTYVSTNVIDGENQVFASFLNYPPACGCTDPNYIEFNSDYSCSEDGACQNLVVIGCMDEFACNYDSSANFNIQSLCCYPGFCQDRDIEEVCPQIKGDSFDMDVFPNPAEQFVTLQVISGVETSTDIDITNYNGISVYSERLTNMPLNYSSRIDISNWVAGIYHVRVKAIDKVQHSILVKL